MRVHAHRWRQVEALLARGLTLGLSPIGAVDAVLPLATNDRGGVDHARLSSLRALLAEGIRLDEALQLAGAPAETVQALSGGGIALEGEAYVVVAATTRRRVRRGELIDALGLPLATLFLIASTAGSVGSALYGLALNTATVGPASVAAVSSALLVGIIALVAVGLRWPRIPGRLPFVRGIAGRERAGLLAARLATHLDVGTPLADALDIIGLRRAGRSVADGVPVREALLRHGVGRWLAPELAGAVNRELPDALRDAQAACWSTVDDRWRAWIVIVRTVATLGLAALVALVAWAVYGVGLTAPLGGP